MTTSTACSSHQFNAKTHENNTWVLSGLSLCPRRRRTRRNVKLETSTLSLVPIEKEKSEGLPWPAAQDNAETASSEFAISLRGIPSPNQRKLLVEAEPDKCVTIGAQAQFLGSTLGQLPTPRHCLPNPMTCLSTTTTTTTTTTTNGYRADMPCCISDSVRPCATNSSPSRFTLVDAVDEDRPLVGEAYLPLGPDTLSTAMSDTMSDSGQCLGMDTCSDPDSHSHSHSADLGLSMENDNVMSSSSIVDNKCSSENMEVQSGYNGHPTPSNLLELPSSLGTSSSPPPPPRTFGLSRFYAGKSRSFSCLGDVVSLADVVKPENPYAKKRKYNNVISSFDRTSQLPPLQKDVATAASKKTLLIIDGKGCQRGIVASRSYSFSDLQGVGTQISPC